MTIDPPAAKRRRRPLLGLFVVAATLLVACGVAELAFRVLELGEAPPQYPAGLYSPDELRGYRLTPGFEGDMTMGPEPRRIRVGAAGLRDDDPSAETAAPRVFVLGDSLTFGHGVLAEDTFPQLVEGRLAELGVPAEVSNFGVPGYTTVQQRHQLREACERWSPDVVVLALYLGNDFRENGLWDEQHNVAVSGVLVTTYDGEPPSLGLRLKTWFSTNSRVGLTLLRRLQQGAPDKRLTTAAADPCAWMDWNAGFSLAILRTAPDERTEQAFRRTCDEVSELVRYVREETAARFLLAILPGPHQYHPAGLAKGAEVCGFEPGDLDLERPQKELAACLPEGLEVLDLTPVLRDWCHARPAEVPFTDVHFNELGHRLVAEPMTERIQALLP